MKLQDVTVVIPAWNPPSLNDAVGVNFYVTHQQKRQVANIVATYAVAAGLKQTAWNYRPVRRVTIVSHYTGTPADRDNVLKILLDAMKRGRLIVDDNETWCRWDRPVTEGGHKAAVTTIRVRDLDICEPLARPEDDPATKRAITLLTRKAKRDAEAKDRRAAEVARAKLPPAKRRYFRI